MATKTQTRPAPARRPAPPPRTAPQQQSARQDQRSPPGRAAPNGGRPSPREQQQPRSPERQQQNALVSQGSEAPPAELEDLLGADAGRGTSSAAEDNLVPLLYILQPLSPQVLTDNSAYIDGAVAGDIWLKNASDPVVPGNEGVYFQPCWMYKKIVEWVPRVRGGGFVMSHDVMPEGAKQKTRDPQNPKKVPGFMTPDGNELVDTRYEAGFVWRNGVPMPYVIPFKSTGHAVSRGWMNKRNSLVHNGSIMPSWSHVYQLTTLHSSNASGEWYKVQVGEPIALWSLAGKEIAGGDVAKAYELGRNLNTAFQAGDVREEREDETFADDANVGDGAPPQGRM